MLRVSIISLTVSLWCFATIGCSEDGKAKDESSASESSKGSESGEGENNEDSPSEVASDEAPKEPTWSEQVAATATKLHGLVKMCHDDWISKYEPDNIRLGKPAVYAPDGVVWRMEKACDPIKDLWEDHRDDWLGKHPDLDSLVLQWSLFVDLYRRSYRYGSNLSRKLAKKNHWDMVRMKKELVESNVPALLKIAAKVGKWNAETTPKWPQKLQKTTPSEAGLAWRKRIRQTLKDAEQLRVSWKQYGHDLKKKEHRPRLRYLRCLGQIWQDRRARARTELDGLMTGDASFDKEIRAEAGKFYDALDFYYDRGWLVAMKAFDDEKTLDPNLLRDGRKALKKTWKKLQKAAKRTKIPNAG